MKFVISRIRQYIQQRTDLARLTQNLSWVTVERAIRLLIGLFVMSILARYLGTESFGLLSLGIAIISICIPFTELGLQGVIIKTHVEKPEDTGVIVGTVLTLRIIGALASAALATGIAFLLPFEDPQLVPIVALLCFTSVFRTSDSFRHIFEARVFIRPIALAEIAATLTANMMKIMAVLAGASVLSFAFIHSIEFAITAVCIIATYRFHIGRLSGLRFSSSLAIEFLRKGWPLLLSTIAVLIYMKIDQLMLGVMLGKAEVGIYSIAVRISETWYFIPGAIVWSAFPLMVKTKMEDPAFYIRRLIRLYRGLILLGLSVAVVVSLSSDLLVNLLFGDAYSLSSKILLVHIWGGIFASLGIATRYWAINENLQHLEIARTISGALLNIVLNLYLIPTYWAMGAAYATLLSLAWSGFVFDLFHPATRKVLRYKFFAACFWRSI